MGKTQCWGKGDDGRIETPPRAWGRLLLDQLEMEQGGNTPTSVGKTRLVISCCLVLWKHPHERGEDRLFTWFYCYTSETPPRAWGRREFANEGSAAHQKHPHERGEDWLLLLLSILTSGNTPTSVGKTDDWHEHLSYSEKHPHERGEDASKNAFSFFVMETPPRAWGRPAPSSSSSTRSRNTPTSVGKTRQKNSL